MILSHAADWVMNEFSVSEFNSYNRSERKPRSGT